MLDQGNQYASLHSGQHGGALAVNPSPAPPGYTGMLEDGLRAQAWVNPIDDSVKAIQGMSDQAGGARRRRKGTKRGKRATKRGKRATKRRRGTRRVRRMRGGSAYSIAGAQDVGAPGMLLSPGQEQAALGSMNPEWKLAMDPNSFAPNLSK